MSPRSSLGGKQSSTKLNNTNTLVNSNRRHSNMFENHSKKQPVNNNTSHTKKQVL